MKRLTSLVMVAALSGCPSRDSSNKPNIPSAPGASITNAVDARGEQAGGSTNYSSPNDEQMRAEVQNLLRNYYTAMVQGDRQGTYACLTPHGRESTGLDDTLDNYKQNPLAPEQLSRLHIEVRRFEIRDNKIWVHYNIQLGEKSRDHKDEVVRVQGPNGSYKYLLNEL